MGTPIYPKGFSASQKRGLRQQAATFELKDGVLYYVSTNKITTEKILLRVVIGEDEKKRLLQAFHDGLDGGHFGRDKTLSKVFIILHIIDFS